MQGAGGAVLFAALKKLVAAVRNLSSWSDLSNVSSENFTRRVSLAIHRLSDVHRVKRAAGDGHILGMRLCLSRLQQTTSPPCHLRQYSNLES